MKKTIGTTCFKIDRHNAKALILGFDKNGTSIHQSIYCDVKKRHIPMLITYNKSPSSFPLSKLGKDLNNDNRQLKMKYIVDFEAEYFIHNKIELWNIICNNGLFDIWLPEAPFNRFNNSDSPKAKFRIVLLRIFEIEEEFYESDIIHASSRIDQIKEKSKLEVTIKRPIIDESTFIKTKKLLKDSIKSYSINFDKLLSNEESVYELPFIEGNEKEEIIYPDELDSNQIYSEGKSKKVLVNAYERNPEARKKCIEYFGSKCQVCSFSFMERYGKLGIDFIHVHHRIDIAEIKEEYNVNPITDLIPVCPNCHAMLHKKKPAYTIDELKQLLNENTTTNPVIFKIDVKN